jgi:hypothetical protein
MHRRLVLAGLAATGGLLTSAFLQVAVAAADAPADVSATGADAFTIGGYTFDPFWYNQAGSGGDVVGWEPVSPLSGAAPLLTIGGGTVFGLPLNSQDFEVYNPTTGADLGTVDSSENVTSLFGLTNTEFTVTSDTPADGGSAADMPTVGSVYDEFNLGNGYENVYTDIPSTTGGSDTVTDTLVTPHGDINLDSLFGGFDAAAPMQPGDAFTGLAVSGITGAKDAFGIGGFTLDPTLAGGGEGFNGVAPLETTAPVLELGGYSIGNPDSSGADGALQSFDVYSGNGSSATDVGNITTGEDVTNLLGFTNTQLIVTGATAADGGSTSDLPTVGSVYDAFNFGNGVENVYTATPGADGTVTDTLVTPFGNINLDSLFSNFDAAAPMQPGDAFTGLEAGESSIGTDAFTIGGTTFDPITSGGTEGYDPVYQIFGADPLLELGGGTPNLFGGGVLPLNPQDFDVYSGSGSGATEIGSIQGNEDVLDLLGMTNTEFTVASVTGTSADLPAVGSVYDAFNFGDGIENVYTAIPGVDGAPDTVTDELVTPFGNFNLDSLFGGFDAVAPLDPGNAFGAGLDLAGEAATSAASAIDPLSFLGL